MKALCFGSLNIDYVYKVPHFVGKGETLASDSLHQYCGGKGLNQAVALARAGLETYMAGAVGRDGDFLIAQLRSAGVDTRFVAVGEIPTGHAIIQNTPDGDNCILLYGGANRSITRQQAEAVLCHFGKGDMLLLQNEISALEDILLLAKERGMLVALNPSPMEDGLLSLPLDSVDYLILNRVEASQLLGGAPKAAEDLLQAMRKRFPHACIVLTLGEQGSMVWDGREAHTHPAIPVVPVDTTGAGDTFTGFFLAGVLNQGDAGFAQRYATAAAALAVTRPGAAPSIPKREEVLAGMDDV